MVSGQLRGRSARRIRVGGALLTAAILLGGCASLSEGECLIGDWRGIGYEDGAAGRDMSRIGAHRKACADYGVSPDLHLYQSGREEGLRLYCTARKGFEEGTANRTYHGVCPVDLEPDFMSGYEEGRELFTLRQDLAVAESQLSALERELDDVRGDMDDQRRRLEDAALPAGERKAVRDRIAELEAREDELRWDLREAERRVDRVRDEVDEFERDARWQ